MLQGQKLVQSPHFTPPTLINSFLQQANIIRGFWMPSSGIGPEYFILSIILDLEDTDMKKKWPKWRKINKITNQGRNYFGSLDEVLKKYGLVS